MLACEQTARSAFNGNTFPPTIGVFSRSSGIFEGEANVVGDKHVQMTIAVVVHERAACSKPRLIAPQPGGLGHIGEGSVAVVAIKSVLAEVGAEDIVKAIVVVVPDADSTSPSERAQTCFLRNIRKRSVAVVFVQAIRRAFWRACEP